MPNHDSGSITVIDTATNSVIDTIKVAPNPHWVDISADGKTLYAANHESNLVSVIDTATDKVTATVPVGLSPHSILRHPTKPLLFNVNYDSSSMTVIDTNTNKVVKTVPTASHPQDVSLSADGEHTISPRSTTMRSRCSAPRRWRSPRGCGGAQPDQRHGRPGRQAGLRHEPGRRHGDDPEPGWNRLTDAAAEWSAREPSGK